MKRYKCKEFVKSGDMRVYRCNRMRWEILWLGRIILYAEGVTGYNAAACMHQNLDSIKTIASLR